MRGFFQGAITFRAAFRAAIGGDSSAAAAVMLATVVLVAIPVAAKAEVEWVLDGEATATYDSNVSRAERDRDILSDESLLANLALVLHLEPTFKSSLNFRGFAEGEVYREITTLNRATLGGQMMGRWQPVVGFRAPVYQLSLTTQLDDYGVDQRDSMVYSAQLFASQHINDSTSLAYGIEGVQRRSKGTVFDTRHTRLFINADFALSTDLNAYAAYSYLHGDTFSSAQLSFCNGASANDIFGLIQASDALETDAAFNETFCGSWLAYRLKADTHALTLGLNKAFSHKLSADLSVQGADVNAKGDNNYQRTLVRLGLLARF